jgi:hypothetical protein
VSIPTTNVPDLLVSADRMLVAPPVGAAAVVWRRGAAFALRAALEAAVSQRLQRSRPEVKVRSMRARMICLRVYDDAEAARQVQSTWNLLCLACHYRPYDPGPTEEQLTLWQREVCALVRRLDS